MEKIKGNNFFIIQEGDFFDFTEKDVLVILNETKNEIKGWKENIIDANEKDREKILNLIDFKEKAVQCLSIGPENVVSNVKKFYDRVVDLSANKLSKMEIASIIFDEFPDIEYFYGLLRKRTWGYNLGQLIFAVKMDRWTEKNSK